jgi:virginiamycin B lyase
LPNPSGPAGIAIGPEGSAWVAMSQANAVDRIAADGTRTRFPLPAGSEPQDIVLGPDGAFWIAELGSDKIGRMTTAGAVTNEYPVPGHGGELAEVSSITTGPDEGLWFTEGGVGKIARLVPDPPAGLPTSVPADTDTLAPRFIGRPVFSPSRFKVVGKGRRGPCAACRAAPSSRSRSLSRRR